MIDAPLVVATVMVWNEEVALQRLLPSLHRHGIESVVCVDGAYASAHRETEAWSSTDASEQVAAAWGAYWKPAPREPYQNEVAGRNAALDFARDFARREAHPRAAWAFYIDADETLEHYDVERVSQLMRTARALRPTYYDRSGQPYACRVRLFPLTPATRFHEAHYDVVDERGDHLDDKARDTDAIVIRHWPRTSQDKEDRAREWYANRHARGCH